MVPPQYALGYCSRCYGLCEYDLARGLCQNNPGPATGVISSNGNICGHPATALQDTRKVQAWPELLPALLAAYKLGGIEAAFLAWLNWTVEQS